MKVAEDAAIELPLNDERIEPATKQNRHVVVALNHLNKRDAALTLKINELTAEREVVREAIKALTK